MKRAQAGVVLRTAFSQAYVLANDADDIRLLLQILSEVGRISHTARKIVGQSGAFRNYKLGGYCGEAVGIRLVM